MRFASRALGVVATLAAAATIAGCSGDTATPTASTTPTPSVTTSVPSSVAATPTASASASATTSAALARFYGQRLRWTSCGGGGDECATLKVPSRYDAPDIDRPIKLSVIRNPANASSGKLGALVVNPGGPGGSGYDYARASNAVLPQSVLARYDIVGFDPRGVQRSKPAIDCISDATLDAYIAADTSVDNAAEQLRLSRAFAKGCATRSPDLFGQVGTRDAAKDMDILRDALGEKKLDYLGKSYGTLLGITYAETFPDHTGRMVLDGVLDPSLDAEGVLRGQAAGFERAYRSFLADCVRIGCPLGTSVDGAYQRTLTWMNELDDQPLGSGSGRKLTKSLAQLAILGSLYEDRSQWMQLRVAIRSALENGKPAAMLALADNAVDREPGGHFPDNSNEAQYAVTCLDRPYTSDVTATAARATSFTRTYPLFGEYIAWGDLPCNYWKAKPTRLPHRITAPGIPPILILGTTRDPATPLAWSQSLRGQLANSRLITWKGDGHTAYFRGSGCVDALTNAYLLKGAVPATDRTCSGR